MTTTAISSWTASISNLSGPYLGLSSEDAHAEGLFTSTNGHPGSHIMGRYGAADADYSWFVANGTSSSSPGLAAKLIGATGDMFIDGVYSGPASDYAELFETVTGQPIEPGYFVALKGRKVLPVNPESDYVLGVTTANPGFLGNAANLSWKSKFLTDEWGRVLTETVRIPPITNDKGEILVPEREEEQPRLNPSWDPARTYIARSARPEGVAVGLMGRLRVRDDGSCSVDGYCVPNYEGIATEAKSGYRVIERPWTEPGCYLSSWTAAAYAGRFWVEPVDLNERDKGTAS